MINQLLGDIYIDHSKIVAEKTPFIVQIESLAYTIGYNSSGEFDKRTQRRLIKYLDENLDELESLVVHQIYIKTNFYIRHKGDRYINLSTEDRIKRLVPLLVEKYLMTKDLSILIDHLIELKKKND